MQCHFRFVQYHVLLMDCTGVDVEEREREFRFYTEFQHYSFERRKEKTKIIFFCSFNKSLTILLDETMI